MMECMYGHICLNNTKCLRCSEYSLFKSKDRKYSRIKNTMPESGCKTPGSNSSWEDLEQQVADSLNHVPDIKQARRSRASGALWFEKGDIVDEILHPECKERQGNTLKTGEKTMSVKKEWLEKAANECRHNNKVMCLPFRFKGDDRIYTIFRHEDIAELITLMKAYMHDNDIKDMQIKQLQEQAGVKQDK